MTVKFILHIMLVLPCLVPFHCSKSGFPRVSYTRTAPGPLGLQTFINLSSDCPSCVPGATTCAGSIAPVHPPTNPCSPRPMSAATPSRYSTSDELSAGFGWRTKSPCVFSRPTETLAVLCQMSSGRVWPSEPLRHSCGSGTSFKGLFRSLISSCLHVMYIPPFPIYSCVGLDC